MCNAFYDEISGEVLMSNYHEEWKEKFYYKTGLQFGDRYGDVTGTILYEVDTTETLLTVHTIESDYWTFKLSKSINKDSGNQTVKLRIKGCPSKIYYGGKNYRNIPLVAFNKILVDLAENLCLNLEDIKITGPIEPSFTAELKEVVLNQKSVRGRIVSIGNKVFVETKNSDKEFMGFETNGNQSHITTKIYLPSIKFREQLNSLRVESRYNKVQSFILRTGIKTWADLVTPEAQYEAYLIVRDSFDNTVIIDPKLRRNVKYPVYMNQMIHKGKNPSYWLTEFSATASDKTRKKRIEEYRELSFRLGDGLHTRIRNCIEKEGEYLRNIPTRLTGNNSELDSKDCTEDCTNNNGMIHIKADAIETDLIKLDTKKSRKHVIRENHQLKQSQNQRFMEALKITLTKLAA